MGSETDTASTLQRLASTIRARRSSTGDVSYTRQLLEAGPERCARKFGEEAIEAVLAAVGGSDAELSAEAADVIYHLLVLLESRNVDFDQVLRVLETRMATSGLAEKAARGPSRDGAGS